MPAYDVDALRDAHGEFPVHEETFAVDPDRLASVRADARRDALGGARAVIVHGDRMLLIKNRGEAGDWDAVGGAREPGEAPAETVRREVREEVGLDPDLGRIVCANRLTFAAGDAAVTGVWPYFRATASTTELDVQDEEVRAARWFSRSASPPDAVDRLGRRAILDAFEEV